jgi:hypothetical protein
MLNFRCHKVFSVCANLQALLTILPSPLVIYYGILVLYALLSGI